MRRMPLERRRFMVTGRVQGVGFRAFVARRAAELGVTGWVRNRDDGAVEAEAQGSAAQLEAFEQAVRRGPSRSRVDQVETADAPVAEPEARFQVTDSN